jgi:hypothetical protein
MPTTIEEATTPVRIGAGSFSTIFVVRGRTLAFKVAHTHKSYDTLKKEYEAIGHLYATCNTDSFFRIPKPLVFYDTDHEILLATPSSPVSLRSPRIEHRRPTVINASFFNILCNENPVYAMDRVFASSVKVANRFVLLLQRIVTHMGMCNLERESPTTNNEDGGKATGADPNRRGWFFCRGWHA